MVSLAHWTEHYIISRKGIVFIYNIGRYGRDVTMDGVPAHWTEPQMTTFIEPYG